MAVSTICSRIQHVHAMLLLCRAAGMLPHCTRPGQQHSRVMGAHAVSPASCCRLPPPATTPTHKHAATNVVLKLSHVPLREGESQKGGR